MLEGKINISRSALMDQCFTEIKSSNGSTHYTLRGYTTHGGHPITSESRAIIRSIQNEFVEYGNFDAVNRFGMYSAFSTFRDSVVAQDGQFVTKELVQELIDREHFMNLCPNPFCPWNSIQFQYRDLVDRYLNDSGINVFSKNNVSKNTSESMVNHIRKLKDYQVASMVLLNGMFAVPVSIILTYLDDKITGSEIADALNSQYQIDDFASLGEQRRVINCIDVIDQFNRLMGESMKTGQRSVG